MRRLFVLLSFVLLAVACGNGDTTAPTDDETATPTPATADETEATVQVAQTSLGEVLVGSDGMTLYLFTRDTETSSACTDTCAELWPPLLAEDESTAGQGADGALLGTITRQDGSTQVTYGGHPLYTYTPDEEPGDVNGHGVGDVWFAINPDGTAVEASDG